VHFLLLRSNGETLRKKTLFESQKNNFSYPPPFLSDKGFKGTNENLALLSLHGGSHEVTLTVPLSK